MVSNKPLFGDLAYWRIYASVDHNELYSEPGFVLKQVSIIDPIEQKYSLVA